MIILNNWNFMSALQKVLLTIEKTQLTLLKWVMHLNDFQKYFLEHDATQNQQYSKVWHYEDWAKENEGIQPKTLE